MNDFTLGLDPADLMSWTSNGFYLAYFGLGILALLALVVFSGVVIRIAGGRNGYSEIDKLAR